MALSGKLRVGVSPLHDLDVRQMLRSHLLFDDVEHRRLDVVRIHSSGRAHTLGESSGHVPGAGADIRNDGAGRDPNEIQRPIRLFLLLAYASIEPTRVGCDTRNLTARQRVR